MALPPTVVFILEGKNTSAGGLIPFSEFYFNTDYSIPKAYICKNYTCDLPTSDLMKIREQLEQ